MCSVEAKRLQSSCDHMYSTPTASAASRSDDAAERHLRVGSEKREIRVALRRLNSSAFPPLTFQASLRDARLFPRQTVG